MEKSVLNLYPVVKKVAFCMDPEFVHDRAISFFSSCPQIASTLIPGITANQSRYSIAFANLKWPFPVGVAAGLDKNGVAVEYFSRLGFGAVEVGSVTPIYQQGNPRPRIFRHISECSLRNHMGIPSDGMETVFKNLTRKKNESCSLGINISQNSAGGGIGDYLRLVNKFHAISDYLVINVSCPNVGDGRKNQDIGFLDELLSATESVGDGVNHKIFIKVAPDVREDFIFQLVKIGASRKIGGFVATNTLPMAQKGRGGISGKLLYPYARTVRHQLLKLTREISTLNVIGVGGFFCFADVLDFWNHGGKFVQIFSSFIYKGPSILQEIKLGIDELLSKNGRDSLQEYLSNRSI